MACASPRSTVRVGGRKLVEVGIGKERRLQFHGTANGYILGTARRLSPSPVNL